MTEKNASFRTLRFVKSILSIIKVKMENVK